MSKCIHCGAELPLIGDCPLCAARPGPTGIPPIPEKDLQLNRRTRPGEPAPSLGTVRATPLSSPLPAPPPKPPAIPTMNAVRARVSPPPPSPAQFAAARASPPAPAAAPPAGSAVNAGEPPREDVSAAEFVMRHAAFVAEHGESPPADDAGPVIDGTDDGVEMIAAPEDDPAAPAPASRPVFVMPPAPDVPEVATPATGVQEIHARPASLWRRAISLVVDATILGGVVAAYLAVAARIVGADSTPSALGGLDALVHQLHAWSPLIVPGILLALLVGAVYAAAFAILWGGRTPGRMLVGIRLVDGTGYAPTPGRAAIRAALSIVSFVFFLGGFWLALFDRRGQTLHDKLTRTFVVQPI